MEDGTDIPLNFEEKAYLNRAMNMFDEDTDELTKQKCELLLKKSLELTRASREAINLDFGTVERMKNEIFKWHKTGDEEHIRSMMRIGTPFIRKALEKTISPQGKIVQANPDGSGLMDEMKVTDEEYGEYIAQIFKCYRTEELSDIQEMIKTSITLLENWADTQLSKEKK